MQPGPLRALPAVDYAERSDPGRDPEKQVNEDACGWRETRLGHLCVVCDGMGGHASGREAATLALATIFETFVGAADRAAPAELLRAAIEEASRRVHVMPASEIALGRPGSTVVALLVHPGGTEIAHVGDSRAYHIRQGQIFRLTRDHSVVQEMVDRGLITPQQAARHPDANRITRALGMAPEVEAELRPQPISHRAGDAFVLCSDGLSDTLEDHEILEIVASEPPPQAVGRLVDLANARGGHDNITVIVVRTRESALPPSARVAPTLPQTLAAETAPTDEPSNESQDTVPAAPAESARLARAPAAAPGPAPAMTEAIVPPGSTRHDVTRIQRRAGPLFIAGALLALIAVVLLGSVLIIHFSERRGKRGPAARLDIPENLVASPGSDATTTAPTPLAPERVVLPSPSPSGTAMPIAPLEPPPPSLKTKHNSSTSR
jgi:protein phosphatase